MLIDKRRSRDQIVSLFHDSQTVMVGGFAFHGVPFNLIDCALESGAKHLTLIALDASPIELMRNGRVDKVIMSHSGSVPENLALIASGLFEVEFCPMGTLAERMRAGGSGLGGVLVKTGMGTSAQEGRRLIEVEGETYILETALKADISLVRAYAADPYGNLTYKGAARNSNPYVAMAGDITIVEPDVLIDVDMRRPEDIITPGIFVNYVLNKEKGDCSDVAG